MSDWTPDETSALLRGETVVRWVEMEKQPENEPVPAHKWPGVRWCAPSLWIWRQKCGCEKSIHAPHRPGDRVEVYLPCPGCTGNGGDVAYHGDDYATCTAAVAERREVRVMDSCPLCVCDPVATACANCTPTRWGWREEWRLADA